ncbi:MAG: hypothetical protein CBR30_06730 [Dictyoglomus sp. NZ13-RE01]|nr:MAG: hypothetical protein CBR30_06730 [Dictyoglomus sp. NZ13-RE01]
MIEEKYIDYLDVFEEFYPVYDIENEAKNYWKQFIPTDDFKILLEKFLDSLESQNPAEKKSIFVQGRYGTGKSHATGVIKHLLWDPYEEIEDFVNNIDDSKIRERLKNYRLKNRIFPVTLKNISTVFDVKSLSLTIETAVKKALIKENIEINIKSEFDKYIDAIENDPLYNWNEFINIHHDLKILVKNKEELLKELKSENIDVLQAFEKNFKYLVSLTSIENWLEDVINEVRKYDETISGMCIYWDEFTSIFDLPNSNVLLSIFQNIAEKTPHSNVYLFIVSHRSPSQSQYSNEDFEKILGRFKYHEYKMEEITTYRIMSKIINKKDFLKWKELRDEVYSGDNINNLISELSDNKTSEIYKQKESIKNIFPIHPYTAYITFKLAEYIGSSQRSIFSFFNDEEKGFVKFIKEYPLKDSLGTHYFLTADYIWDYFHEEFIRNPENKLKNVLEKERYLNDLKKLGKAYESIYKGILLLNILNSFLSVSSSARNDLYTPSEENIKRMFIGTPYERYLKDVLNYINKQGYIPKTPDNLFLISVTPLPQNEVIMEKENFKKEIEYNILNVFSRLTINYEDKFKDLFESGILRPVELLLLDPKLNPYEIEKKIKNAFHYQFSIHLVIFLPKFEDEIKTAENVINSIITKNEEMFKNKVFIICHEALGEKYFNDLIEYFARYKVADRHGFSEEKERNYKYIESIVNKWLERIETGNVKIYYLTKQRIANFNNFKDVINREISKEIFTFGPENIEGLLSNENIWKKQISEKTVEIFLLSSDRNDLEDRAKSQLYKSVLTLLKTNNGEYIVNDGLLIKETIDPNHPTVRLFREVERKIKEKEGRTFYLSEALDFIFKPPFGIYPSIIGSALISFTLRPFVNKLYEPSKEKIIDAIKLKEKVISLMKYIIEGKDEENLKIRLGIPEEKELEDILRELFEIQTSEGLKQTIYGVKEWIINKGKFPLWSIKYIQSSINDETKDFFLKLIQLLISIKDELKPEDIKKINAFFKNYKTDLKLILKPDKLEEGFKNWLQEKVGLINKEEWDQLINFLNKNFQEELAFSDENKLLVKISDWKNLRKKELLETELVNILANIFELENVSDLKSVKNKIKEKINNDIKSPLWLFSYIFNDQIKKIIIDLKEFLDTEAKLSEEIIEKLKDELKSQGTLLKSNLKKEYTKIVMESFLKSLDFGDIIDNIDALLLFIQKNIEKEPYYWDEKDLRDCIIKYKYSKFIEKIFNIEHVNNFKDLKNKIINSIIKLNYPFWSFSHKNNQDINEIIYKLITYLNSNYMDENIDFYQEMLNLFERNKDGIEMIFDENRARSNYREFIVKTLDIRDEDLEENIFENIIEDIRLNMKIEELHLNKQTVENYIHKNSKKYKDMVNAKRKENIKNKIRSTNKDLKEILIKLIDENPSICEFIERMLD